ncbi:MAG: serine/threonine-protein kinase [Gemmatimonadaceae bacterium]
MGDGELAGHVRETAEGDTIAERFDETFLAVQSALVGEYSLERELGRGGMGIVYLAREVRLDRLVAIKVLPPQFAVNEDLRLRFVREAQTAARLSHPNIVPIFRVGEASDFVYFAMAFVEGETLTQRVRAKGPLAPHEGARILREAAWALAYAHARGIVHRDVKPDNIMLEQGTGRALLTDFGIAHVESPTSLTESGLVLGTAHYMSPEQAAGEKLDGRSDLYSLGIVAHFMLAGKLPFDDASVPSLLAKHITQPAPPLASIAPTVPRKLGEAIDRCLLKSPDQRYTTGESMAEALTVASEPPREIPAAIRVWISKGEQNRGLRIFFAFYLGMAILPVVFIQSAWFGMGAVGVVGALAALPGLLRTRRVLRAGYTLDDLRSSLRLHWTKRQEELAYENVPTSRLALTALWSLAGISWATVVAGSMTSDPRGRIFLAIGGILGIVTTVLGIGDLLKRHWRGRAGSMSLKFWNSRWGERFIALAKTGLTRIATAPVAPQLTEIALGRAADALFEALPSDVRRELRDLPKTVRTLEADAHKLREQIELIERELASFDNEAGAGASRSLAASGNQSRSVADERARVGSELSATRDLARSRLAATVAALETIRLGLLRLQLGSAPVESVTAAIEAAQRIADDVGRLTAAEVEVAAVLRPKSMNALR